MQPLKVGIVGGGNFFNFVHGPALKCQSGLERIVICNIDENVARQNCERWGFHGFYADFETMVAREKLDALMLIVPPVVTEKLILRAFETGIPTFTEKPIANSLQALEPIQRAYEKTRARHFVAFNRRHIDIVKQGREHAYAQGGIAHLAIDFFRVDRTAPTSIMGQGIHAIDTIQYLAGDVAEIQTIVSPTQYFDKKPIAFTSLLKFESGITGVFNYNCRAGQNCERYTLFCENTSVIMQLTNPGETHYPKTLQIYEKEKLIRDVDYSRDLPKEQQTAWHYNGIVEEQRFFFDAVREKREMRPNVLDAIRTTRLAEAINAGYSGRLSDFSR
ncbi:MAG TPA: Gfo/Idh/MocA family oxidoreductase [Planctomycetota bacterium]|nr:Gfo/Idh/MocA family oxidoreductase [Planctomycetota bacterium]